MPLILKPLSDIKRKLELTPNGKVQRFLQSTCYRRMDKYVPLGDTGNLRTIVDLSNPQYIVYDVPYAVYQYRGMRRDGTHIVRNYTTPGTGPYWDKRMMSAEKNDLIRELQSFIERGG